ncbi:uncharacterized protein KGF55_001533 [Candida pseudojiufengensis]|uniref:uncharacterized protein n=1 Tax=Candida pseudojiufengensis TaxID=497109 RepID=UPI002224FD36|nr:uncharacterized protein KGF55_001533 [Candida pseudojiufengensis]KAI5965312.1 hypothetical protein KGF55_001533 [Candida pseudojiufengensis]
MSTVVKEEVQTTKRRRIKQACEYCRSKKAKCDGLTPTCSSCLTNNEKCVYTQSSKRRGLPTGYTHDLEKKVLLLQGIILSLIPKREFYENDIWEILKNPTDLLNNLNDINSLWKNHEIFKYIDNIQEELSPVLERIKNSGKTTSSKLNGKSTSPEMKKETMEVLSATPPTPRIQRQTETPHSLAEVSQVPAPQSQSQQPIQQRQASQSQMSLQQQQQAPPPPPQFNGLVTTSNSFQNIPAQFNSMLPTPNGLLPPEAVNFVNDPSFFLNYDIFQFISDEVEGSGSSENDWEPVALQYHGLSSIISGFTNKAIQQSYNKKSIAHKNPFRVGSIFNVSSFAIDASFQDKISLPSEMFQFPKNVRKLVDNYFQIFHIMIPMLDKITVKKQLNYLQSINGDERQGIDCNVIALIWAMIALGESSTNTTGNLLESLRYAKNSIMSLEYSLTSTIETMQAMLLLGIFYYNVGQWDFSWVLISSSTRMAIDVRLMRSATDEENEKYKSSSTLNNISRQRTWAAVYAINTLLAARMGRSPVVRAADWPIPQVNNDGWEEWEPWECYHASETIKLNHGRFLTKFNEFIRGTTILNLAITSTIDTSKGIMDELNDQDKADLKIDYDDRQNSRSMTMSNFESKINEWMRSLPEYCRLKENNNDPPIVAIHALRQLVWCVLVVRLSSLKGTTEIQRKMIKSRNIQYTKAILAIKKLFSSDVVQMVRYYPFVDYLLAIAMNFPQMMDFQTEQEKILHCRDINKLLISAQFIPSMRVSLEISRHMHSEQQQQLQETPKAQESPTIANLLNSPEHRPSAIPVTGTTPKSAIPVVPIVSQSPTPQILKNTYKNDTLYAQSRVLLDGVNALSPPIDHDMQLKQQQRMPTVPEYEQVHPSRQFSQPHIQPHQTPPTQPPTNYQQQQQQQQAFANQQKLSAFEYKTYLPSPIPNPQQQSPHSHLQNPHQQHHHQQSNIYSQPTSQNFQAPPSQPGVNK